MRIRSTRAVAYATLSLPGQPSVVRFIVDRHLGAQKSQQRLCKLAKSQQGPVAIVQMATHKPTRLQMSPIGIEFS